MNPVVYPNLMLAMARKGITQDEIAEVLDITQSAFSKKLHGGVRFSVQEAILIQELFPDSSIQELFAE